MPGALTGTLFGIVLTSIVTGFGFLFRRSAPALRGWALVAGGILAAAALFQGMRLPMVIKDQV